VAENAPPEITAIVCTHNRADVLIATLTSLAYQNLAPERFKVLVVNNASTDNTPEVVRSFAAATKLKVTYTEEPNLGIATARNRGWQEATTPLVAYIDDDARAADTWLETIVDTFDQVTPSPACVTGLVTLDWVGGRPAWFPERYETLIARYDLGPEPKWLGTDGYLVTCNAAFRRQVLQEAGGFRDGLGHRGRERHGGEDNEIYSRLSGRGLPIYYQPRAQVAHLTPKERQTRRYLIERMYATGLSQIALDVLTGKRSRADLRKDFGYDVRMLVGYLVNLMGTLLQANSAKSWDNVYGLAQKFGRLRAELALMGLPLTAADAHRNDLWKSPSTPEK
jgi:glycosyltransferase involved in cell wall biosynthesis